MSEPCSICSGSTFLMFTVAGSRKYGTQNETVCHRCWKRWTRHEVELRVRKGGE